jgi:hypothetical protein
LAPDRFAPGQFVKFVDVGFDTMVQPLMTVSADAGVADAVAKTGVTSAIATTRAVPVIRRRRPTMVHPRNLRCENVTWAGRESRRRKWIAEFNGYGAPRSRQRDVDESASALMV